MKIRLLLVGGLLFAISGQIGAMMRSSRMPARKPTVARNYSELPHIKSKYGLPKPCSSHTPLAELTREQLATHLKHQELCWRLGKSRDVVKDARKQVVKQAGQLVKTSLKHGLATLVVYNSGTDVGPELFATMKDETALSLKMAQAAVKEYKKIQKNIVSTEQELMEMVAEQKRQLRIPCDIQ